MAGRKKTPPALSKLRGNPRKAKRAPAPEFEASIPDAPAHLEGLALFEWNRVTQELAAKQVISNVDMAILAVYCEVFQAWTEEANELKGERTMLKTESGYVYQNPRVGLVKSLRKELQSYSAELGMTPVSRGKVHMTGKPAEKETKEQSLANKLFKRAEAK